MWRRKDQHKQKDGWSKSKDPMTTMVVLTEIKDHKYESTGTSPGVTPNNSLVPVRKKSGKSALNLKSSNRNIPQRSTPKTNGKSALNLSTQLEKGESSESKPATPLIECTNSVPVTTEPLICRTPNLTGDNEPKIPKAEPITEDTVHENIAPEIPKSKLNNKGSKKSVPLPLALVKKEAKTTPTQNKLRQTTKIKKEDSTATEEFHMVNDENENVCRNIKKTDEVCCHENSKPESATENQSKIGDQNKLKEVKESDEKNNKRETKPVAGIEKSKSGTNNKYPKAPKPRTKWFKQPGLDSNVKRTKAITPSSSADVKSNHRDKQEFSSSPTVDAAIGSDIMVENISEENKESSSASTNCHRDTAVDPIKNLGGFTSCCESQKNESPIKEETGRYSKKNVETRNSDDMIKKETCCRGSGQGRSVQYENIPADEECCILKCYKDDEGDETKSGDVKEAATSYTPDDNSYKKLGTCFDVSTTDEGCQCEREVERGVTVSSQSEKHTSSVEKNTVMTQTRTPSYADTSTSPSESSKAWDNRLLDKYVGQRNSEVRIPNKCTYMPVDDDDKYERTLKEDRYGTSSNVNRTYNIRAADMYSSEIPTPDERKRTFFGAGEAINGLHNSRANERSIVSASSRAVERDVPQRVVCGNRGQNIGNFRTNDLMQKRPESRRSCRCGNGCGTSDNSTCCCRNRY